MPALINLVGQTFGYWIVLEKTDSVKGHTYYICKCLCGLLKPMQGNSLKSGNSTSCGCMEQQTRTVRSKTHRLKKHPLYSIWCSMKQRCYDSNYKGFKHWGGRGVKVCKEWEHDFLCFYNWALSNGWQKGLQLDKDIIPKSMGIRHPLLYSPDYCCFVTSTENARNTKRVKLTMSAANEIRQSNEKIKDLAIKYNVSHSTIENIINNKTWV